MAKLIKVIVVLAVLAAGIALVVHYSSRSESRPTAATPTKSAPDQSQKDKPKEGIQPQEKYGFAPVGEGQ
jgi:flagellar basal body-associated protein FliL